MTVAGDLLTSAVPARLLCRHGNWVLELVRLVPLDRDLFQPKIQRLEGAEPLLQHLKRSTEQPTLAAAAAQLIRSCRADEERAFEAVDGEWVPAERAEPASQRPSALPGPGELVELRAELSGLRASQDRLRERLRELERLLEASSE